VQHRDSQIQLVLKRAETLLRRRLSPLRWSDEVQQQLQAQINQIDGHQLLVKGQRWSPNCKQQSLRPSPNHAGSKLSIHKQVNEKKSESSDQKIRACKNLQQVQLAQEFDQGKQSIPRWRLFQRWISEVQLAKCVEILLMGEGLVVIESLEASKKHIIFQSLLLKRFLSAPPPSIYLPSLIQDVPQDTIWFSFNFCCYRLLIHNLPSKWFNEVLYTALSPLMTEGKIIIKSPGSKWKKGETVGSQNLIKQDIRGSHSRGLYCHYPVPVVSCSVGAAGSPRNSWKVETAQQQDNSGAAQAPHDATTSPGTNCGYCSRNSCSYPPCNPHSVKMATAMDELWFHPAPASCGQRAEEYPPWR